VNQSIDSHDVALGCPCNRSVSFAAFTSDGNELLYLCPNLSGVRTLYSYAFLTQETKPLLDHNITTHVDTSSLSLTEQLRRERARNFSTGVNSFEIVDAQGSVFENRLMIPTSDSSILIYDSKDSFIPKMWVAYDGASGVAVDPHISKEGDRVAFVIENDVYYIDIIEDSISEKVHRLTDLGHNRGIACGVAEFIAQEEMDRYRGFWWSPIKPGTPQRMLITVSDESKVPEFTITHEGSEDPYKEEKHRYPFAGAENASVGLAVVEVGNSAESPEMMYLNLTGSEWDTVAGSAEYYLARAGWWADGSVMVQLLNRAQTLLQLLRFDPITGSRQVILEERCDEHTPAKWINLHDMLYSLSPTWRPDTAESSLKGDFYFVWASSRSGYCQPYLYKFDSSLGAGECMNQGNPIGAKGAAGEGQWVIDRYTYNEYLL
jgi:dipeptidyl-peptidase-4